MIVTLDTNVLIAAFIARGVCHELFEDCARHHTLALSQYILNEVERGLTKKFRYSRRDALDVTALIRARTILVKPTAIASHACRDPGDLPVLGTAIAANSRCIVTGDKDLLILEYFQNIDILSPRQFWQFEEGLK